MKTIYLLFCSFVIFSFGNTLCAQEAADLSLSLDECITQTLATNPELAYAREASGQREALLNSAKKDLYPSLSANYTYTHQPDSFYFPAEDEFSYGVTAEQPLYQGRALVTGVKQAKISLNASVQDIHRNINDLVFNVYSQYFELLQAEKLEEEALSMATRFAKGPSHAYAMIKAALNRWPASLESFLEMESAMQAVAFGSQDFDEGRSAFLEKRKPVFEGR